MSVILICAVALAASCLTFFSGFGLGTILMPVFAIFFPLEIAIALTAVVHFLNNIFKFVLLWKEADWRVIGKFGFPAFIFAWGGAKGLFLLEKMPPLFTYSFLGKEMIVAPVKLMVGFLILVFLLLESLPFLGKVSVPQRYLPLGGMISGFLGGLSGHQGALRSVFLIKCGLSKETYIATGVIIACLVDFSRISVYSQNLIASGIQEYWPVVLPAVLSAFTGVYLGRRFMKKVTMKFVQVIVSGMLLAIAVLLGMGMI
ncbi:MAG TPA: hypothetical protein DD723_04170 [Candidatus Omnitrophica bacterium]|nr:MAG: hypothetical protein A2Z81_02880 [Omnitrophica WOR_2 bacterium GWA2_45_18]HBR14727.1 hypothetical protein [Candidatus Omnitrophota bacterium]